ncbi:MAG: glycosyl hydrolase family 32, partial [Acidobacteria bacterium]
DAGPDPGMLVTRPVTFSGKHLFVNVHAPSGELRVDVFTRGGQPIAPFSRENSIPVRGDTTSAEVRWNGAEDLSALAGQPVRFRFHLTAGSLYSFWVSPDKSGASHGYVAAGGPGFTGPTDTVGRPASRR